MIRRNLEKPLLAALAVSPVVLLQGPRQCGKSTLARSLVEAGKLDRYITLDDIEPLALATKQPDVFVERLKGRVVIDEVQRAPELLRAIKARVDRERAPGRFLLTGSANVLMLPKLSETLAGRMRIVDLWPFAQDELAERASTFIDALFAEGALAVPAGKDTRAAFLGRVLRGGYPPIHALGDEAQREGWFDSHARTLTTRTVPEIVRFEGLLELPRLLQLLAARTGTLLNMAEISRHAGIPQTTLKRYMAVLQAAFLIRPLPGWTSGAGRRLIRAPKLWFTDTGFAAGLLRLDAARLDHEPSLLGHFLESFVGLELLKLSGWSKASVQLHHFRTANGREVDLVLEGPGGRVVGVEVKAAERGQRDDAHGLEALAEAAGKRFHRGVVLYTGSEVVPIGRRMDLVPLDAIWRT